MIVIAAMGAVAAAECALIAAMIVRSGRPAVDSSVDGGAQPQAADWQPEEFAALRADAEPFEPQRAELFAAAPLGVAVVELAEPFTDVDIDLGQLADGDVFAPTEPPTTGRHHHDTVEMVAMDYLIPGAYEARIAPRLRDARQAVPE